MNIDIYFFVLLQLNISALDKILLPHGEHNHWTLTVIDLVEKTITVYNSLGPEDGPDEELNLTLFENCR